MNGLARSAVSQAKLIDKWNRAFAVGTQIRYWTGAREGIGKTSFTRSTAQLLGGHTAVVWVDGESACVALSHVEPVPA
jgi:hypothetical protein